LILEQEKKIRQIAVNKKAWHSYSISDEYEAGLVLVGSEVKSIRNGNVNLKDAYARVNEKGEIYVLQMHISPYTYSYNDNHDPERPRKLLLNKAEIRKISNKIREKGFSLIPLSLYFKGSRIKIKIGIGQGKNLYDKRQSLKEKDANREIHRINKHKDYS
jgi:SsrA-binding protein